MTLNEAPCSGWSVLLPGECPHSSGGGGGGSAGTSGGVLVLIGLHLC